MRGPKPTPTNLRVIKGNDRPDRMDPDEPKVPVSTPKPPDYLTDKAATIFVEHARLLARMRVMTDADVTALAIMSEALLEAREAQAQLNSGSLIYGNPKKGIIRVNPYKKIRDEAEAKALKILTEFGLTPSSRTRVKAT